MFQQCLPPMATVCHGSTQETPLENACDFAKASIKFASSSARQDDCITARRSARLGDLHHAPYLHMNAQRKFQGLRWGRYCIS